jgi:hypothetical protein
MIVFDATALSFLFIPNYEPSTPIKHGKDRLEALVESMSDNQEKIGIPSPALSEFLVTCDEKQTDEFLKMVRVSPWLEIMDFDSAAAVEVSLRTHKAIQSGDKREGLTAENAKIKFDRQIVGIAIASHATKIISDDKDVKTLGDRWGMEVLRVEDLPIPEHLIPPPLVALAIEADEKAKLTAETSKPTAKGGLTQEQPVR